MPCMNDLIMANEAATDLKLAIKSAKFNLPPESDPSWISFHKGEVEPRVHSRTDRRLNWNSKLKDGVYTGKFQEPDEFYTNPKYFDQRIYSYNEEHHGKLKYDDIWESGL